MNVLVTGGAGFIGSNLVEELIKDHNVIVVDNFHTGSEDNLRDVRDKIRLIKTSSGDVLKLDLPHIDHIYHIGIPSSSPMYKECPSLVGDAINDTISILEFAKETSVQKMVVASSSSLYNGVPPPHKETATIKVMDYYIEARLCIERITQLYYNLYGVNSIALRFFSVYGSHEEAKGKYANVLTQSLWDMKKDIQPVIYGDGTQTRDLVYVKDVVHALILAMESNVESDVFNVGTGVSYNFNELVSLLNKILGKNIKPVYVENPIKNYVSETLADLTKIKSTLGYKPSYTIEEGLRAMVDERKSL